MSYKGYPSYPIDESAYGVKPVTLGDNWATKYKFQPDDVRFEGTYSERIAHLRQRGAGNDKINYWIIEAKRLVAEEEMRKQLIIYEEEQSLINEIARIKKEKEDLIEQELQNQRIEKERKQKEMQNQIKIQNEIEIQKPKVIEPEIIAISSLLPLGAIVLLLYTSMSKK